MYVITVEFTINPAHQPEFMDAMRQQAHNSLELEKNCHHFDIAWSEEDQNLIFLYEVYTDRAAFEVHCASDHFRSFNRLISPWVTNKIIRGWIQPV